MALVYVPRNEVAVVESLGVYSKMIQGGDRGTRAWLWPWEKVVDAPVRTGIIALSVLEGTRRLHLREGSWVDFQEATLVVRVVDPLKVLYDVTYKGEHGMDAAWHLTVTAAEDVIQSFVAGQDLDDAIYMSGPEFADALNLVVPHPNVRPEFAALTSLTGIAVQGLWFSGVTLSEKYIETMEEIALDMKRLGVEERKFGITFGLLKQMMDEENGPPTLEDAVNLLKGVSQAEFLREFKARMHIGFPGSMATMFPDMFRAVSQTNS